MKVKCPACQAVYNLDEAGFSQGARRVKCAKCRETFYITSPNPPSPPVEKPNGPIGQCPQCGGRSDNGYDCPSCGLKFFTHFFLTGLESSRSGRLSEAILNLDRAIGLEPASAQAYAARGECYLKLGQDEKGLSDLDRAMGLGDDRAAEYLAAIKSSRRPKDPGLQDAAPPSATGQPDIPRPERELFKILIPRLAPEEPEPLKQFTGILGSALLLVGVFMPFLRLPVIGLSNYFAFSRGDGILLIVLAAASLFFTLSRRYTGTGYTGFFSSLILSLVFYSYKTELAEMQKMAAQLKNTPLEPLAGAGQYSIQLEWGFAVMVVGAILILATSAIRTGERDPIEEEKNYISVPVKARPAIITAVIFSLVLLAVIGLTQYSPYSGRVQKQTIDLAIKGISAAQQRYKRENHRFADKARDLYYIYVPDPILEVKMISADRFKWRAAIKHKYADKPVIYDSMGGLIPE